MQDNKAPKRIGSCKAKDVEIFFPMKVWEEIILPILRRGRLLKGARPIYVRDDPPRSEVDVHQDKYFINC